MRIFSITCMLVLIAGMAYAQKCSTLLDSAYDTRGNVVGMPAIVFQKEKTRGTTADGRTSFLWLRRDFFSAPKVYLRYENSAIPVNTANYIFLYGELMHDSTLRDMGDGRKYHGKITFIFANGDSITVQTYPIAVDRLYPNRQNISFVILLNNHQSFPDDEMRRIFGIRKVKMKGDEALREKLKAQPLKQVRYMQSYVRRNEKGEAVLRYADPVIISYTADEARRLQQAMICLTKKVVDKRFP